MLKGGQAMLLRVHDARTTRDVDLLHELGDPDAAVTALRAALSVDLGDYFRFTVSRVTSAPGGTDQPEVDGCRATVDAYCGGRKVLSFGVDLVTGSLMTDDPQIAVAHSLDVPGLHGPSVRLYPVVDHIADKLCATQATYGALGDRPSSRVRDLADLVVLARIPSALTAQPSLRAVHGEWAHRGLTGTPEFSPPSTWERLYPPIGLFAFSGVRVV